MGGAVGKQPLLLTLAHYTRNMASEVGMALTHPKLRVHKADKLHTHHTTPAAGCKVPGEYKEGWGGGSCSSLEVRERLSGRCDN